MGKRGRADDWCGSPLGRRTRSHTHNAIAPTTALRTPMTHWTRFSRESEACGSAFAASSSRAVMAASRTPRAMASAWRRSMPACAITERGSLCAAARTHSRRRHLPSPPGPPCQDRAPCRSTPRLRDGRRHPRAAHRVALQALALDCPAAPDIPPPSPVGAHMRRDAAAELPVTVTPLDSSAVRLDPHRRRARRHPGAGGEVSGGVAVRGDRTHRPEKTESTRGQAPSTPT